jgi:hypothetical protein
MAYLRQVGLKIEQLDGSVIDVAVNAHATSTGRIGGVPVFATGGVVPQYLASGGFGPRGTDTVPAWLTPGEMVLNKTQQANLWAAANGRLSGGGGMTVNVHVSGSILSERELIRVIRDQFGRGGIAGVAA